MGFLDGIRRRLEGGDNPDPGEPPEGAPAPRQAPVPWERMAGEPAQSWSLFLAFLETPSANVSRFAVGANSAGIATSTIQTLATRWRWIARRAALEAHLAHARAEGAEEQARAQGAQIARIAQGMLDQAEASALALELRGGLERMSARDSLAYRAEALKHARLLRGEVTERVAVDYSGLSLEEMQALHALHTKATGGGG